MPITWRRKDDKRSCSIDIELLDVDYTDQEQWTDLIAFHCKMSRELADYIVYAYEDEIRSV